jgi:hypothetical protein
MRSAELVLPKYDPVPELVQIITENDVRHKQYESEGRYFTSALFAPPPADIEEWRLLGCYAVWLL